VIFSEHERLEVGYEKIKEDRIISFGFCHPHGHNGSECKRGISSQVTTGEVRCESCVQ